MATSNGVYSLYNGWVKMPSKDAIPDKVDLEPELSEWKKRAEECDTADSIGKFIDDVYALRKDGILVNGEYSKDNLIFKELRNEGILDKLKEKKVEKEDEDMSLKESFNDFDYEEYKGLAIERLPFSDVITVFYDGDDVIFDTVEEAREFIDEVTNNNN